MSLNIGHLIDRVFREYLEPNDDVSSFTVLKDGMTDSSTDTIIDYDNTYLTSEEEDALGTGAFIEVGEELMLVASLNTSSQQITVVRAARGTTIAAHTTGDLLKINPPFTRKVVFDAISDQVENLYPTLFAVETITATASTGYVLLGTHGSDADTYNYLVNPIKAISQYTDFATNSDSTGSMFAPVSVQLIQLPNPFVYTDDSGTERTKTYTDGPSVVNALQFYSIASGHSAYITFKKKFIAPANESTTLASIGLESEYEPIVMAGVAAQIMSGRDIPMATQNYITESLQAAVYPVGSSTSIRNSLLQYQQILIQQARKNLRARYPESVSINGTHNPGI
jgi:hypothetical protein|tara:strand:- start:915 stop:1931 length:1017 start_codon:yes stop_codon:yes gene_type:complete